MSISRLNSSITRGGRGPLSLPLPAMGGLIQHDFQQPSQKGREGKGIYHSVTRYGDIPGGSPIKNLSSQKSQHEPPLGRLQLILLDLIGLPVVTRRPLLGGIFCVSIFIFMGDSLVCEFLQFWLAKVNLRDLGLPRRSSRLALSAARKWHHFQRSHRE